MSHRYNPRRAVAYVAMGALLAVASLTLSQCTQVGDNLVGVDLSHGRGHGHHFSCKEDCDKDYKKLVRQENKLHKSNLKACRHDDDCIDAEKARHKAALYALQKQNQACKATCHKQGGGDAG